MERVVKFVNEKFKYAGSSTEVQNQKEELIASLHDKIHDALAQGKSEDEAFASATASLDGLDELTGMLDGRHRTVRVNLLNLHHAWIAFGVIAVEMALGALGYVLGAFPGVSKDALYSMFLGLGVALVCTAVWPAISTVIYAREPGKAERAQFDFRRYFVTAIIGWTAISLGLAIVNIALMARVPEMPMWFVWPMIGISNWPVSLLIYNRLYHSKKYQCAQGA